MAKTKAQYPKGVWFQRYKLKTTGEVVRYGYYGRGRGSVALGHENTPEFHERLSQALRKEPVGGSVANLIFRYKTSVEFSRLRPLTRRDYMLMLDRIQTQFGALSLRAMADRAIAEHIYRWRDSMSGSPRRADYAVQVLKVILSWGVKRGHLEFNRAAGVERLYTADRREKSWSDDQVAAFLDSAPEPLGRALILAIETGQRQGDLLTLSWGAVKGGVIELRQSKTGQPVAIPISEELKKSLGAIKRGPATTILTKTDGFPWEPKGNGFRAAWRDACKDAKISDVTFHDLRGTFVTRRLAEGWTPHEVASCTGHSIRDLGMLDRYADRGRIAEATAQRIIDRAAKNAN